MRVARFFIDAPLALGTPIELPPRTAHHALRVLRLRGGDPIVLFNGKGGEFSAHLAVNGSVIAGRIISCVYTDRAAPDASTVRRVISLRFASREERARYVDYTRAPP